MGFDKSNFLFVTPNESNRKKWKSLWGINLFDGQCYQIAMHPSRKRDKFVPDSLRIILRQYPGKAEVKSLAPDGTPSTGTTQGLLLRSKILGNRLVPVGKETDRHWEQGEDPSLLDFKLKEYRKGAKMVVAEASDRKKWKKLGVRRLIRESGLTQKPVYAILAGSPVRPRTFAIFRRAVENLTA